MHTSNSQSTRDLILEAAFMSLAEASLGEVLSFVGPTSLSRAAAELVRAEKRIGIKPPAPETVAYHFHTKETERTFNLDGLADELVDQACAQIIEAAEDAQRTYLAAADQFASTCSFESLIGAVDEDLAHYRPGGDDPLIDARERLYFTAVALCDMGSDIAKKLYITNEQTVASAVPIYERFLQLTGRRMVADFSARELASLVAMLLEGESLRARYRAGLPLEKTASAMIRIFWAFSVPIGSPEADVQAELIDGLSG